MTRPISKCMGFVCLLIGLFLGQPGYTTPDPVPTIVSAPMVVFPLRNTTGDAGLDWVSIGLQDSLTMDLWYVSTLHTKALPEITEVLGQVCPDPTLACIAGQDVATWWGPAKASGYGGFLWGEYRREGETLVLRLGWYELENATLLAEQTVRGASLPELLAASTTGLSALLAARRISVTDAERARMSIPKTAVAAAWEHNALGYWEQIRHKSVPDDAQRTARATVWEQHLQAAVQADPAYAEAWNNLGWQRYIMKVYGGEGAALSPTLNADVAFQQALRLKPELIDALMGRGNALKAQEKPAEALPWYERAVALNPSLVGHRWVLVDAYLMAKRPEAVLAAYVAWDADLARQGDTAHQLRLELAHRLEATGKTLAGQNQLKDAEPFYRRALAIREAVQGLHRAAVLTTLKALAEIIDLQGRSDEARALQEQVNARLTQGLAVLRKKLGGDNLPDDLQAEAQEWWQAFEIKNTEHLLTVLLFLEQLERQHISFNSFYLAILANNSSKVSEIKSIDQVFQFIDQYPTAAADLINLKLIALETDSLLEQGRYTESALFIEKAKEIFRKISLNYDREVKILKARIFHSYAQSFLGVGRYFAAQLYCEMALELFREVSDIDSLFMASLLNNTLGLIYLGQNRYIEAEQSFKNAQKFSEQYSDPNSVDMTINIYNNMGLLYLNQYRYPEAELWIKKALDFLEKLPISNHPAIAIASENLALVYLGQNRHSEAEPLLKGALAWIDSQQSSDLDHKTHTVNILINLANLYTFQNRTAEAESLYHRALAMLKSTPPLTKIHANNSFANFLIQQKRLQEAVEFYEQAIDAMDELFVGIQGLSEGVRYNFISQHIYTYRDFLILLLKLHEQYPQAGYDQKIWGWPR